jgi:hypothetical protein
LLLPICLSFVPHQQLLKVSHVLLHISLPQVFYEMLLHCTKRVWCYKVILINYELKGTVQKQFKRINFYLSIFMAPISYRVIAPSLASVNISNNSTSHIQVFIYFSYTYYHGFQYSDCCHGLFRSST